jgi:hypothetical protein
MRQGRIRISNLHATRTFKAFTTEVAEKSAQRTRRRRLLGYCKIVTCSFSGGELFEF